MLIEPSLEYNSIIFYNFVLIFDFIHGLESISPGLEIPMYAVQFSSIICEERPDHQCLGDSNKYYGQPSQGRVRTPDIGGVAFLWTPAISNNLLAVA